MNNFFESDHLEVFLNNHPKSIVFAFLALRYVELGDYDKALAIAEPGIRTRNRPVLYPHAARFASHIRLRQAASKPSYRSVHVRFAQRGKYFENGPRGGLRRR